MLISLWGACGDVVGGRKEMVGCGVGGVSLGGGADFRYGKFFREGWCCSFL